MRIKVLRENNKFRHSTYDELPQYILDAIEDAENGRNLGKKYTSVDDFLQTWGWKNMSRKDKRKEIINSMTYIFRPTKTFKKDFKRLEKQGKDLEKLHEVIMEI